jgi:hypothetical protein
MNKTTYKQNIFDIINLKGQYCNIDYIEDIQQQIHNTNKEYLNPNRDNKAPYEYKLNELREYLRWYKRKGTV